MNQQTTPTKGGEHYSRRETDLSLRFLKAVNNVICRAYHHTTVRTPCPLPQSGAAIVVSNHISGLDPLLLQSASQRLIRWMMAAEYQVFPLRTIFRTIGIIPVQRSGKDLAATRQALRALADGYVVGIFPEGKIATTDALLPFQKGIALLAARSGAPVYPAYLEGTQRGKEMIPALLTPNVAEVRFGPPIAFQGEAKEPMLEAFAYEIFAAVSALRTQQIASGPRSNRIC